MKKAAKAWLITAAFLVLAGCILFAGVMSMLGWDFAKLSTARYETNIHEISETFSDISLTTDTADIVFALSNDGKCRVECYEPENAKHSAAVANDTLIIEINEQKSWYDYIGFQFGSPRITVYLPQAEYGALSISESTGRIEIPKDFSFERADISASTGSVVFSAAAQAAVKIKTGTGNICVENNSVGSLDLSVTTGKAAVSKVTCAGSIAINVSTGAAYLTDVACKSVLSNGTMVPRIYPAKYAIPALATRQPPHRTHARFFLPVKAFIAFQYARLYHTFAAENRIETQCVRNDTSMLINV